MNSSEILKAMNDKLGVSKPVFIGRISSDGEDVRFELDDNVRYRPSKEGITDPVELLVIDEWDENFNKSEKVFKKYDSSHNTYCTMFNRILRIYEYNSPLKNPTQSKLYKWLYAVNRQSDAAWGVGIISLYRYIFPYIDIHTWRFSDDNKQHVMNMIAILEKIKDKYG